MPIYMHNIYIKHIIYIHIYIYIYIYIYTQILTDLYVAPLRVFCEYVSH